MRQAWQELNLHGGGLQSMNARLTRQMKRRRIAYPLCGLFPLGLHRFYLDEPIGGSAYVLLSLAGLGLGIGLGAAWALGSLAIQLGWLMFDLVWIDRRVVTYNKDLRKRHFLQPGASPPEHYKGRYLDETDFDDYLREKESERAGHQPSRGEGAEQSATESRHIPSFAEQEAMLRELSRRRRSKQ